MRRFADAVVRTLSDVQLCRIHPLLRGLVHLRGPPSECAQFVADTVGSTATRCSRSGLHLESKALRKVAQAALEDLHAEKKLDYHERADVIEQLVVRALEQGSSSEVLKAVSLATQGAVLAREAHDLSLEKRFNAARHHAELQATAYSDSKLHPTPLFDRVERFVANAKGVSTNAYQDELAFYRKASSSTTPAVLVSPIGLSPNRLTFAELLTLSSAESDANDGNNKAANSKSGDLEGLLQLQKYDSSSKAWAKMEPQAKRTLKELLEGWQRGNRESVVFDEPLLTACPELLKSLRWPGYVDESDLIQKSEVHFENLEDNPFWDHPSLFVQPGGSHCGIHVDGWHSHFVQAVLCGRKRWVFWPFGEMDQIRWMGRRDEVSIEVEEEDEESQRRIYSNQYFHGASGMAAPDAEFDPVLWAAVDKHHIEVEVQAGEMVFVPAGTPHQVFNLEDTIAVSRNFIDVKHALPATLSLRWPAHFERMANSLESIAGFRHEFEVDRKRKFTAEFVQGL